MKRLLGVCTLILCVSFPAFAGHTVAGDNYCSCGTLNCLEDYPGECSGKLPSTPANAPDSGPEGGAAEWGIVLVALLLWLRLKA
jgi:hypothetical protein